MYVYKPRDSRVSQAFECLQYSNIRKSNARMYTSRMILECLKHLNACNVRMHESGMHESRMYTTCDSQVSQTFECSQYSNIRKSNAHIYTSHVILECLWMFAMHESPRLDNAIHRQRIRVAFVQVIELPPFLSPCEEHRLSFSFFSSYRSFSLSPLSHAAP